MIKDNRQERVLTAIQQAKKQREEDKIARAIDIVIEKNWEVFKELERY